MADGSAGCGETCGTLRASLRSAARRRQNAAVERREAPAHGDVRGTRRKDAPFGAPLPSAAPRERKAGAPRALTKNRGDGARPLFDKRMEVRS